MGPNPDYGYYNLINNIWCNFIRTYDPNGNGVPAEWKPYDPVNKTTAVIKNAGELEVGGEVREKDMTMARRLHANIVLEAEQRH